ncbi:site-2 protease family protein [Myxococcota bacterium]|nr:site-2 protease family protein [Myxococcota bacterium]MBU1432928.1 site-2 protease family protein [Myxococcota bacterium]
MALLISILGFNLLVLLHELGHLLIARLTHMRVLKFSIGFGPALARVTHRGTLYQIALIPVGGFVQIEGMSGAAETGGPESYLSKPLWQRALMVSAGPAANFLFAGFVYFYLFFTFNALSYDGGGRLPTTVVREVSGAAAAGGMRAYDTIEQINGTSVQTFRAIREITGASGGATLSMVVARPPEGARPEYIKREIGEADPGLWIAVPKPDPSWPRVTLTVTPERTAQGLLLGVVPDLARFGAESWLTASRFAVTESYALIRKFLGLIGQALRREETLQVASVVKITEVGADTVKMGSEWFLDLLALLSLNLGFLNLLPLPALDGGRLIFIAVEAVARRPVPPRLEGLIHGLGILLLMAVMVWAIGADIAALF